MTDHDRGAYSPQTDAPLAFDARHSRRGGGFPTTLVVSVAILAVLIVATVLFYRSGVREVGQAPVPVGAPVGAIKAPAPKQTASADPATGLQIYKTEDGPPASSAPPAFSAPPEEPQPRPAPPVQVRAPAAPPVQPQPLAPAAAASAAAVTGATTAAKPAAASPPAHGDAIADLLDKPPPGAAKPAAAAKPPATASASAPAPTPAKAAATVAAVPAKPPVAAAPTPTASTSVKPADKPAVAAAPATAATGAPSVQIGAYSSPDLAAKGWDDLSAGFAGDMAGKGKHFEPVAKDGKTLYRAAVTGFASRSAAAAFCAKLKSAGHACLVK